MQRDCQFLRFPTFPLQRTKHIKYFCCESINLQRWSRSALVGRLKLTSQLCSPRWKFKLNLVRGNKKFLETDSHKKLSIQIPEKKLSYLIKMENCQHLAHKQTWHREKILMAGKRFLDVWKGSGFHLGMTQKLLLYTRWLRRSWKKIKTIRKYLKILEQP